MDYFQIIKIQDFLIPKKTRSQINRIMKLTCFILLTVMLHINATTISQTTITVTGTVSDAEGPLPGVSVRLKGTTSGTATDSNGRYSINVPDGDAVLQFSFIGYLSTEIEVGSQTVIDVTLREDTQQIEEVVVVGYATVKKVNLTGSVDQIRGDVLENRAVVSTSQALQGTMANLNITSSTAANQGGRPGAYMDVNIRGYSGLGNTGSGSTSSPLIVVDGVQSTMDAFRDINPNDIESISILKDAASSSIYGSSAPYGVILITTKKGSIEAKPKITYSNNFGFSQPINLPHYVNSLVFAERINEYLVNAGRPVHYLPEAIQRIKDHQAGLIPESIQDPNPGADAWLEQANNDWYSILYKDFSFSQQQNVGVSGGTKNVSYYVGLGYNHKGGQYNLGNDSYNRFNLRTNLSVQLTDWLSFNTRGAFSEGRTDYPTPIRGTVGSDYETYIARSFPTWALKYPTGEWSWMGRIGGTLTSGARDKTTSDQAAVTGEFVVTPLKGWNVTINYTFDKSLSNRSQHHAWPSYTLPSGRKVQYQEVNYNSLQRWHTQNERQVINAFTSYERDWGSHNFTILAGYVQELTDYLTWNAMNRDLYTEDIPSFTTMYGTGQSVGDELWQIATRGVFGRINYGYAQKYLFEVNVRYDGTSRFLKDKRWAAYPGVSAAWVVSKEEFWTPLRDAVNTLKFRASYGSLGDQSSVGIYPFYPSMSLTAPTSNAHNWYFDGGRQAAVSYPGIVNPQLTWISTSVFDLGADITVLQNRLSLVYDWYIRKAVDFVGPAEALPAVMGANAPQANNASIQTNGFDMTLIWRDHIGELGYSVRAVLSDYQAKVLKYPNPSGILNLNASTGLVGQWRDGAVFGDIWGYETYGFFKTDEEYASAPSQERIFNGSWGAGDIRYVDRNGNGEIDRGTDTYDNPGDLCVIGNTTPRYQYSVTLDANWKEFDLSIFIQGVGKRQVAFGNNQGNSLFWSCVGDTWWTPVYTIHEDRWTPETPNGYYPKMYQNGNGNAMTTKNSQIQTRYLQNAAYMRFKNMQIGYTLPKSLTDRIQFNRIRIYANVENLATATKLIKVMDPEFVTSGGKVYPLQRTWAFGVNITF